jgi:hypothetical protein
MDEGVDPRAMCRSLVERIAQSEQLRSVADPELLLLFEDWLEELENEVTEAVTRMGSAAPGDLAKELGLSQSGATFLITKLKRDGKIL